MSAKPKPKPKTEKTLAQKLSNPDIKFNGRTRTKVGNIGRPSKYEDTDIKGLLEAVALGIPVRIASAARGIKRECFDDWLNTRPEFARGLAAEQERILKAALTVVFNASKESEHRGATWWLNNVYRDDFKPADHSFFVGGGLTQNNFTITFQKAEELDKLRSDLLPDINASLGLTNGNGA